MTSRTPSPRRAQRAAALAGSVLAVTALVGCGGQDGLRGQVATTGPGGRPGSPVPGGWVATFGQDQFEQFLVASAVDGAPDDQLGSLSGRVQHEDVAPVGGALAAVDLKGRFVLGASGHRVVCLLQDGGQVDLLRGCGRLDLPASGRVTLTLTDEGVRASAQG